jgi:hypothetical protein
MPVSGLVLSLSGEPKLRAEALARMGREPRVTLGVCRGVRMAAVLETATLEEHQQLSDWLCSLPGIVLVTVAFAGLEPPGESLPATETRRAQPNELLQPNGQG